MSSGPTIRSQEEAMSSVSGAAGHAALAICESMLLSLTENKVIDQTEARVILADAAAAHRNAIPLVTDGGTVAHEEAALLIETILKGGNSVRHG
jgi:predicted metal-dependent phosphotriesterase family hydrolase